MTRGESHSLELKSNRHLKKLDWAGCDLCNSKIKGEADSPATWCHPSHWNQTRYVKTRQQNRWWQKVEILNMETLAYISVSVWTIHNWIIHCLPLFSAVPAFCMLYSELYSASNICDTNEQLGQYALMTVLSLLLTNRTLLFTFTQLLEVLESCFQVLILPEDVLAFYGSHKFLVISHSWKCTVHYRLFYCRRSRKRTWHGSLPHMHLCNTSWN
jgi:hypothetical protein